MIETLEDIIESLADQAGVYGGVCIETDRCKCRAHWTSKLRARIEAAFEVERKLSAHDAELQTVRGTLGNLKLCSHCGMPRMNCDCEGDKGNIAQQQEVRS